MRNPSKIATLVEAYNKGLLTKEELLRLKREALKVNVYTGKVRENEKVHQPRTFKPKKNNLLD